MKESITFPVPVIADGTFDLPRQQILARRHNAVADALRAIANDTIAALDVVPASIDDALSGG